MLKNVNKILTGDILKILCDMGHGDEIVLADANFPAFSEGPQVIQCLGSDVSDLLKAILPLFPLDTYRPHAAALMDLTDSDKAIGMPRPEAWSSYADILTAAGEKADFEMIERYAFYERARHAFAIIQTGETRQYGNLLLVKGVI